MGCLFELNTGCTVRWIPIVRQLIRAAAVVIRVPPTPVAVTVATVIRAAAVVIRVPPTPVAVTVATVIRPAVVVIRVPPTPVAVTVATVIRAAVVVIRVPPTPVAVTAAAAITANYVRSSSPARGSPVVMTATGRRARFVMPSPVCGDICRSIPYGGW